MDPKAQARMSRSTRSAVLGAMFLMATSAIGPGFITQTTAFTAQLGAAFAFAIVASILVDIAVQLNVWRVIGVSTSRKRRASSHSRMARMMRERLTKTSRASGVTIRST